MGVLGGVFVLKSGLRILIRALEVPFLGPPKCQKWVILGVFGYFGGTKRPEKIAPIGRHGWHVFATLLLVSATSRFTKKNLTQIPKYLKLLLIDADYGFCLSPGVLLCPP